jgi:hypothetical protein
MAPVSKFSLSPESSWLAPALSWQNEHARLTPSPMNSRRPASAAGSMKLIACKSNSSWRPSESMNASTARSSRRVGRRKSRPGRRNSVRGKC